MNGAVDRQCWCGSGRASALGAFALDDGNNFPLVRCDGCGVHALFPPPDDDQLLDYYSSEYYGSSRRKFVGPIARLVSWFQGGRARLASRFVRTGGRVLDVGCGNGGFLIQMKQRGFAVEGTEWTKESAARVPADAAVHVHVGDLLSLALPPGGFDLITLWHVFEHVRQPYELLVETHRLLKPGGRLLLSLPNAESRQARKFGLHWFHHDPPRHLFGFGVQSLSRVLSLTNFEVTSINTFSLEQNPFGFVQSWLNKRGYPRDRLYTMLKGMSRETAGVRVGDFLRFLLLTGPALAVSTIESMRGNGATMTIHARKRDSV